MSATIGNQWWKLRAKHGREKIFANPDLLWESACEYFEATEKRKWVKKDWVGKDAEMVYREADTPFTITGLCTFLGIDLITWGNYKTNENYKDFFNIITHIEQIIYTQKFEGAVNGIESFWSFTKRRLAKFNGVTKNFDLHLKECEWRWNRNPDELNRELWGLLK